MKKLIPVIFLSLIISNFSLSQWVWQNPVPPPVTYYSIKFFDANTGIVGGEFGTLTRTTDGGNTWNVYKSPIDFHIYKLSFININTGFAACGLNATGNNANIIKTTNGGINWTTNYSANAYFFKNIQFVNNNTGYATGKLGLMVKSTNQGSSWSTIPLPTTSDYNLMYFINENTGWILTNNGVCNKTLDGGNNWISQIIPSANTATDIFFLNSLTGWIISSGNGLSKTTDGGNNWQSLSGNGNTIYFTDQNTGYKSNLNNIEMTTNGGTNWNIVNSNSAGVAFSFPNSYTGYTTSFTKTTNGGYNWYLTNIKNQFSSNTLNGVSFINENTGWVVSSETDTNKIYKTTNGGYSWLVQYHTIENYFFNKIIFFNLNSGVVCGNSGKFGKTTNGGVNWIVSTLNSNDNYTCINFIDENTGWMAINNDLNQRIIKTTNGGINWNYFTTPTNFNLVQFINSNTGWAKTTPISGNSYFALYKTTNGGINWSLSISNDFICSFNFIDLNIGFFIYFSVSYPYPISTIYIKKTTNGGNTWGILYTETLGPIYTINPINLRFLSSNNGIFQTGGSIFTTKDGGASWVSNSFVSGSFKDLSFINENTGWVVGSYGAILKTSNAGSTFVNSITSILPSSFSLSQNYPNPFNPTTNIQYQIKENAIVTLKIYDILGKEIETLVNEKQSPGTYEVTWDASAFPSGVYFYKLTAGDFTETKKMFLIK